MDLVKTLIIIFVGLFVLNLLTHGYVWNKIVQHQNPAIYKSIACLVGLYFLTPLKNINGFLVPIPDASDLLIAAFLTFFIYTLLKFKYELSFKHALMIFLIVLLVMKIVALMLVVYAGAECLALSTTVSTFLEPVFWLSLIIGLPTLIWFLVRTKVNAP